MPDPIPVRVRDCACPDTPHPDGDVVYLAPMLGLEAGIRAEQDLIAAAGDADQLTRRWLDTFLRYSTTGWNLTGEGGAPVPFDVEVLIADWRLARPVANAAADLYSDAVLAPFVKAPAPPSPTGPTVRTTSPIRRRTRSSSG